MLIAHLRADDLAEEDQCGPCSAGAGHDGIWH
jgi:hypothetical protein